MYVLNIDSSPLECSHIENILPYQNTRVWSNNEVLIEKKTSLKWKNQIDRMENGLEKSKNVTKIVVD